MDKAKIKHLEKKGWIVGNAYDFLGFTPEEKEIAEAAGRAGGEAVVRQKLKDQRDLCWAAAWGIINGKIDIELEEKLAEAITNAEEPNF